MLYIKENLRFFSLKYLLKNWTRKTKKIKIGQEMDKDEQKEVHFGGKYGEKRKKSKCGSQS